MDVLDPELSRHTTPLNRPLKRLAPPVPRYLALAK